MNHQEKRKPTVSPLFFVSGGDMIITMITELNLTFEDDSWPMLSSTYHDREISRAIVIDGDRFLFVHVDRDDAFGKLAYIETSGGGNEPGETHEEGLLRELREELGIEVQILCKLGTVTDYYNKIARRNHNHYYLVKKTKDVPNHLMPDEIHDFHLTRVALSASEALNMYESVKNTKLGHLIYQREMPIFRKALEMLKNDA